MSPEVNSRGFEGASTTSGAPKWGELLWRAEALRLLEARGAVIVPPGGDLFPDPPGGGGAAARPIPANLTERAVFPTPRAS